MGTSSGNSKYILQSKIINICLLPSSAQAQAPAQLGNLALFSVDPATHPLIKVYFSSDNTSQWSNKLNQIYLKWINICFGYFHARHAWAWESNKNKCIVCNVVLGRRKHKVKKYTLTVVTFPGHESNKNKCMIYKIVLDQVTLSE